MKQIDKIARELKWQFAGRYNDSYHSAPLYLDTEDDKLYVKYWGQGERWLNKPTYLITLCGYSARYGNWADEYGKERTWELTKKRIAKDLKSAIRENDINAPKWLMDEIEFYTK